MCLESNRKTTTNDSLRELRNATFQHLLLLLCEQQNEAAHFPKWLCGGKSIAAVVIAAEKVSGPEGESDMEKVRRHQITLIFTPHEVYWWSYQ